MSEEQQDNDLREIIGEALLRYVNRRTEAGERAPVALVRALLYVSRAVSDTLTPVDSDETK